MEVISLFNVIFCVRFLELISKVIWIDRILLRIFVNGIIISFPLIVEYHKSSNEVEAKWINNTGI